MTVVCRVQVEWPTSVVVCQGALAQYQVLFRHLFELELASRSLHATWRAYQATRALFRRASCKWECDWQVVSTCERHEVHATVMSQVIDYLRRSSAYCHFYIRHIMQGRAQSPDKRAHCLHSCIRRWPDETLKRAYGLCGQMMHFFAQFRLYLTFEAPEPAWLTMQAQIRSAATLDQVSPSSAM